MQTEQLYFRYADLERIYGIRKNTAYTLVHRRLIPFHRVSKRLILFCRLEIDAWFEGHRSVPTDMSESAGVK